MTSFELHFVVYANSSCILHKSKFSANNMYVHAILVLNCLNAME